MTLEVSLRKATKLRSKTSDLIKTLSNRIVPRQSRSRRYGLEDEVSGGMQVSVYTPSDQLTTMLSTKRAETLSRFEKIKPDNSKDWTWGNESSDSTIKFSIGANSVRPLATTDNDVVVFST